jgi:hypothetical protein
VPFPGSQPPRRGLQRSAIAATAATAATAAWCATLALALTAGCAGRAGQQRPAGSPDGRTADQALLRMSIERPGQRPVGPLRLALRTELDESAPAFELRASDPLGRGLWNLRVVGERALWMDLREKRACTVPTGRGLRILGWPDLPWPMLPAVLSGDAPVAQSGVDDSGRQWQVERDASGTVSAWSLVSSSDPGAPTLRFERRAADYALFAEPRSVVLRWRVVAREHATAAEPITLVVPAGYAEGGCDELELP